MPLWAKEKIKAPEFPEGAYWINSQPQFIFELKGKVVLLDFWDYTCINCIRTFPYLKEWHKRYAQYGLIIIGVHTPEFRFAAEAKNVKKAVEDFGITYPVVLDNEYKIWNAYANQYWPRKYLIDAEGFIVYDHAGEGDYRETELEVQKLLAKSHPQVKFPEAYTAPGVIESGAVCYFTTPEVYTGYERGELGNPEGYKPDSAVSYYDNAEGKHIDGRIYLQGSWWNKVQSLRHARQDPGLEDYIALQYHALSVNAVIGPIKGSPYNVYVKQDDAFIKPEDMGEDLKVDIEGKTYLEITEPRMYRIIKNSKFSNRLLKLYSASDAFEIYAFTFGSCEISKK